VLGDSASQTQSLESVASAHAYHAWLTDLARPYLGEHPVELGSGLGDYAQTWLDQGLPRITVTDRDPDRLERLRTRFDDDARVDVLDLDVFAEPKGSYSSYVAYNVLEHIEDHVGALRAAHELLRPGGAVIMLVPAFQFASGRFDRLVGHVRRYTRAGLADAYREAGLEVERIHYLNAPGLLAWFVGMRLLSMTPGDGPLLRMWDSLVIPLTRRIESKVKAPFGQSVFAVGRVPG